MKAQDIIDRFQSIPINDDYIEVYMDEEAAIQCTRIAFQLIIESNPTRTKEFNDPRLGKLTVHECNKQHYQNLLKELE